MKVKIIILIGISLLLFEGCANPAFNANDKKIVFVEGEPFRIPKLASHTPTRYTYSAEDNKKRDEYRKGGLNCKIGDVLWADRYTAQEGAKIVMSSGKEQGYAFMAQKSHEGLVGCTSPISNREYNFYRGKEMESSANARARSNLAASMMPKTVNVQHSGYVNQNVQHSGYINVYTP